MRAPLLLDTHVFLWWRTDDAGLNKAGREKIANADVVFVSAASAWEAAIKQALGRLVLPSHFAFEIEEAGFEKLPITVEHAQAAGALPAHHRDPFDRMLVAQAKVERMVLVTHDRVLAPYGADIIWV